MISTEGGRIVGTGWSVTRPTDANYAALAIAIIAGRSVDKSLSLMGIKPPNENMGRITKNSMRHTIGAAAYALKSICGLTQKETAKVMHVSTASVQDSIKILKGVAV